MDIKLEKLKNEKPIRELLNFGIANINKPAGMTSFDVVNSVRKALELKKCGHFGTLDPNVTGVLPIALGNACKIQEYFMHHEKIYIGTMQLHKPTTREKLESEMKKFIGKINQLPPRKSRVKRQIRQREIIEFKILNFNETAKIAEFMAEVEAGTYIRKLIDDLGKGINGAQMIGLRRIKAGIFSEKDKEFVSLADFEKAVEEYKKGNQENLLPERDEYRAVGFLDDPKLNHKQKNFGHEKRLREMIIPAEIITKILPVIEINEEAVRKLKNGSPIFEEMLENKEKKIPENSFAVFFKDKLVEIAKKIEEKENPNILARPEVVLY
jgi:tRNA U55 pseudouridine synthase TruB